MVHGTVKLSVDRSDRSGCKFSVENMICDVSGNLTGGKLSFSSVVAYGGAVKSVSVQNHCQESSGSPISLSIFGRFRAQKEAVKSVVREILIRSTCPSGIISRKCGSGLWN